MIKKQILGLLIGCFGLLAASCDDFLTQEPYQYGSEETAITDATSAGYAVTGLYDLMQNEISYGRMLLVIPESATNNIMISASNSNRYIAEAQWSVTASNIDLTSVWSRCYKIIDAANRILAVVDVINATDAQKGQIKAEVTAVRALMHFELVRLFAQAYPGGETTLGIPYMKTVIKYEKPARDDVQTVYTKLITDLNDAINLFTSAGNPSTNAPYRMDIWSTKALLARVYMAQVAYGNAKPVLKDIIDNSGYMPFVASDYDPRSGAWTKRYDAASKKEFMLAVANNATDYGATTSLGYIYLQAGYGDLRVPAGVRGLYTATDVRKDAYFLQGTTPSTATAYFVNKYPSRDSKTGLSDNPVIRLSDIYLLYAEACANTGDEPTAITYLDKVRQRADASATVSTETGAALKDKIFLERRKELVYEGQYFHDLKRLQMPIPTALNPSGASYSAAIPYPSTKRAYLIPQDELDANPNMQPNPLWN